MVIRSSKNKQLTESQTKVFEFIKSFLNEHGVPPSYREIQHHFGYQAIGTVQDHVRGLIEKGVIEKTIRGKKNTPARSLLPKSHRLQGIRRIPVYGEIAAGGPRDSAQMELGEVVIAEEKTQRECFALRVVGDSMIDVGIFEGDNLIVEMRERAKNGDIVVALLDGETTVKRYQLEAQEVLLIPENKKLKPISTRGKNLQIQGVVVGLQRKI